MKIKNWLKFNESEPQIMNPKNLFQFGHRAPNLPSTCYLTDIDGLVYKNEQYICLVENKNSKVNVNDIYDFKNPKSYQRQALLEFSNNICDKNEIIDSTLILIDNKQCFEISKNETKEIELYEFMYSIRKSGAVLSDIKDNIYLEFRTRGNTIEIVGVMYLKNSYTPFTDDLINKTSEYYNVFEVDISEDEKISITNIKNKNKAFIQSPEDWITAYQKLELL